MNFKRLFLITCWCLVASTISTVHGQTIKVLIVDGQNNHGVWPKTTHMMKHYLEQTGAFQVDVYRTKFTWMGKPLLPEFPANDGREHIAADKPQLDPTFAPQFSYYDVVLSNFGWKASPWPKQTQRAFESYMKTGGGFVSVHAANNSFPQWHEFNKMIGIGGWGGRTDKDGPYLYFDKKGQLQRDMTAGTAGGHGYRHEFNIQIRQENHPIVHGLPMVWRHSKDELYNRLRGPAEHVTVLATAFDDKKFNGFGRHEPVFLTIDYHQGRVFHTTLGHDELAFTDKTFMAVLAKGTAWAAGSKLKIKND